MRTDIIEQREPVRHFVELLYECERHAVIKLNLSQHFPTKAILVFSNQMHFLILSQS